MARPARLQGCLAQEFPIRAAAPLQYSGLTDPTLQARQCPLLPDYLLDATRRVRLSLHLYGDLSTLAAPVVWRSVCRLHHCLPPYQGLPPARLRDRASLPRLHGLCSHGEPSLLPVRVGVPLRLRLHLKVCAVCTPYGARVCPPPPPTVSLTSSPRVGRVGLFANAA